VSVGAGCFTGVVRSVLLSSLACVAVGGCAAASASAPSRAPGSLARSTASAHVVQRQPPPGSCHARGSGLFSLPDPRCTPGAIDPAVTQIDIATTICRTGYTETVRPPESVTEAEKRASLRAYGDRRRLHYYEYDHLVPLELGGARNDPRNLWPEPGTTPNPKDELENRLRDRVCDGEMKLAPAQLAIASDWVAAYHAVNRPGAIYGRGIARGAIPRG
jgi:hypothetical protein